MERRAALLLPAPAPVRQGVLKEAQVGEGMAKSLGQFGRPLAPASTRLELGVDVVNSVPDRAQVLEILVVDAEPDGPLPSSSSRASTSSIRARESASRSSAKEAPSVIDDGSVSRMSASWSRISSKTPLRSRGPWLVWVSAGTATSVRVTGA